ncbi:MAG: hypothetical protein Pg6B_11320 [Candidatus Azobacteroides pseudotrichonymphae]|jgi:hypothetical protein|nr:MAG: hypothetical protein Pg6B_11320 [Candidatus Azobacteroides pseudotrichonymphae]
MVIPIIIFRIYVDFTNELFLLLNYLNIVLLGFGFSLKRKKCTRSARENLLSKQMMKFICLESKITSTIKLTQTP